MSWLRIEGKMPTHQKVAPLSDAAFRLHITAKAWCVEHETDGRMRLGIPGTLTRAPHGKALAAAIKELIDAVLWENTDDGYLIHDFLDYNPSAAECAQQRAAKSAAGAIGGKRSAQARAQAKSKQLLDETPSGIQRIANQNSSPTPTPAPTPTPDPSDPTTFSQRPVRLEPAAAPERASSSVSFEAKEPENQRETVVPLDLVERLERAGVVKELAEKHNASPEDVTHLLEEFVGFHAAAGTKKRVWAHHARQRIAEQKKLGRLVGSATPPGLVAHRQQRRAERDGPPAFDAMALGREVNAKLEAENQRRRVAAQALKQANDGK